MKYWVLGLLVFLVACSATQFEAPDIKDDFCGVHINYQFCKCAFHNDYCEAIDMDRSAARAYVYGEYDAWVNGLLEQFLAACALGGGIPDGDKCITCDEGYVVEGRNCVPVEEAGQATDKKNCEVDDFDTNWRKYSDIDDRIPLNERSFEAKQVVERTDVMIEKMIRAYELEYDLAVETQMQADLEEYREALVMDLRTNLLKAFWRLSWVTYSTVKAGQGMGDSYSQVLTSGASVETVGAGLKVVQGVIPGDSALAINTSTAGGKAVAVGAATALEAIDSLGDPTKIATEFVKGSVTAPLPSADISPEEVAILKEQHLETGLLDEVLAESYASTDLMAEELSILEVQIEDLQAEIAEWEKKEKARVQLLLEEDCVE